MTNLDDLEARLSAVERKVAAVQQDAAAARVLAGAADRDVAEFRQVLNGHTQVLNALRETQVEHYAEMREGFARMDTEIADVRSEMREGFGKVSVGMAQITGLLETLVDKD